jgi:hypothetical protein
MAGLEIDSKPQPGVLVFRSPRNWTAVFFFGALASLHFGVVATSLNARRYEAYMSVVFGSILATVATVCAVSRREITIVPLRRRVRVTTGWRGLTFKRDIAFSTVRSVRVTLLGREVGESSVAIVCDHEDVEMPPTTTPRQEALLLAMLMDVRLVKVYGEAPPPEPGERIARLYRNEDAV